MKNKVIYFIGILLIGFTAISCNSARTGSGIENTQIAEAIEQGTFKFIATRAHPMDQTVVNIMRQMDATGGHRILDLENGYHLSFNNQHIKGDLPYFGTRYQSRYGNTDDDGFKFDFKNASVEKKRGSRKTTFSIRPDNSRVIDRMYLEIFKNGKAHLSISANDRQSISYDGYITSSDVTL